MKRFFAPLSQVVTYTRAVYLLLGLPFGVFYFVFLVTSLSLGVGLAIVWVGVLILFAAVLIWRGLGAIERGMADVLLGEPIEAPQPLDIPVNASYATRARAIASDSYTWRSFAWLLLRFPLGIFGFVVVTGAVSITAAFLSAPAATFITDYEFEVDGELVDISWLQDVPDALFWLLPIVGILFFVASTHAISGLGRLHGLMARPLLGPSEREQRAALTRRTSVLEERTMLAHELHDSLGHTLTMMVVQAGAAGHVFDRDPDFAREALANIETSGRQALTELDRILGLLRDDQGAERAPQPDLTSVPGLVEQMDAAGMSMRLIAEGDLEQVPLDVSRFGYRVVQEALTNVLKHAGSVATEVRLHRTAGALEIEVIDEGPGPAPDELGDVLGGGGGRGLVGVRERVTLLGGVVEAGPRPDGGFRVWARLPIG